MARVRDRDGTVTATPEPSQRLSSNERDHAIARLKEAVVDGRLDIDEFRERIDHALAAKTHGDIAALTADLPAHERHARRPRRWRRRFGSYLGVNAVCWSIWGTDVIVNGWSTPWPVWVTVP